MAHAFSFVKSQLTGQIGGGGEHQAVQFKQGAGTAKTEEEKAAGLRKVSGAYAADRFILFPCASCFPCAVAHD